MISASINIQDFNQRPLSLGPILLAQQLVLLPLYFFVPWWIAAINSLAALAIVYQIRVPSFIVPRWLKLAITALAIACVLFVFKKFAGRDAGIALISAMYGLKILETKTRRDANLLLSLGFFLLVAGFLFSQKPAIAFYQFIPVLAILNAFVSLNSLPFLLANEGRKRKNTSILVMKQLSRYLIIAIPIMLILFVFFPRLSGPLWRMPGSSTGVSGVSDTMGLSDITSLQLSDTLAFRAKFEKQAPPESQLYWRVVVLDAFDGLTWTRLGRLPVKNEPQLNNNETVYDYSITLEPTKQNYLVALDRPLSSPDNARLIDDYVTYSKYRIIDRTRYKGFSSPALLLNTSLTQSDRKRYTLLPTRGNNASRDWAETTLANSDSNRAFVDKILSEINQEEYFYTLTPGVMDEQLIDSFWLDKRKGFCEHYASALVFLARAAGIPARVVIGYQGGEKNPLSNYWIVRNADAHAWTEIWFEDTGWTRVDPTAAIARHRIEENLLSDYSQRDSLFADFDIVDIDEIGLLKQMQYWLDQVNSDWNDWILDFNGQRQRQLFSNWGLKGVSSQQLMLAAIAVIALMLAFTSSQWLQQRKKQDPVARAFTALLKRLADKGLIMDVKHPGPQWLISQLELSGPQSGVNQTSINALKDYLRYRYAAKSLSKSEVASLVRRLNKVT